MRTFLMLAIALVAAFSSTNAAVPQLINYQGVLTDSTGAGLDTTVNMSFGIYDAALGGTLLWSEPLPIVTVTAGLFNVLLGSLSPLDASIFSDPVRYLGITVGADPEMTPRTKLVSVLYSFRTATVDGASGGNITSKVSIGPGHTNTGTNAFVAGQNNTASGNQSTVSGGTGNTALGIQSTVGGGDRNAASAVEATVGGGRQNTAGNDASTVGGGVKNTASGNKSTVGGGIANSASGSLSTVGGGGSDTASGEHSTVGGGENNTASAQHSTVGGGESNIASGRWSTIGGGIGNAASGEASTVGGGQANTASNFRSTVSGGFLNSVSGLDATVGGGRENIASSDYASIGGGFGDTASGLYATVPGGLSNHAGGLYSFAAGRRAKANHNGSFVWGDQTDADFTSSAINQFNIRASGGTRIYSSSGLATGVTLAAGGGAWVAVSDSAIKRNIRPVDEFDILEKVASLPISRWSYETQSPDIEHIGPMSQDFYAAFGLGEDDKGISTLDPDGVSMAAIKALYSKNKELIERIEKLEKMIDELSKK